MNAVYLLVRVLETPLGVRMMHPVKAFEREADAKQALEQCRAGFEGLVQGTIMLRTPEGPRAAMPVSNFLAELGVAGMAHNVLRLEVHASLILAPPPGMLQ